MIDKDGYKYYSDFSNLFICFKRNNSLKKIHITNPYSIHNISLWLLKNVKSFSLLSTEYNIDVKLDFKCHVCNQTFDATWRDIISGNSCPYCSGRRVYEGNSLKCLYPKVYSEWNYAKNKKLNPDNFTAYSNKEVWWKCNICGHEWKSIINNRTKLNCGCGKCNKSKGENEIILFLDKYNISYIQQKKYKDLLGIGRGKLSYDFYLSSYNLLIEYQGEQHFEQNSYFHKSVEDFKRQLEHDKLKREYAKKNDIKLLEIPYWDFFIIQDILSEMILN